MKKKIFTFLLFLFLTSCGYEALYSKKNQISYEIEKYGYYPFKNINYRLDQNHFRIDMGIKKLINNHENCENNNSNCEQIKNPIVKKALTNNYIIIINND